MNARRMILVLGSIVLLTGCASSDIAPPTERIPSAGPSRGPSAAASTVQVQRPSGRPSGSAPAGASAGRSPTSEPSPGASTWASASAGNSGSPATSPPQSTASIASGPPLSGTIASGSIDPAAFSSTIDDPWFPLVPGTRFTYKGTKDGKAAVETFTVATATRVVAGVTCVVLEDKVSLNGVASERLVGYYAQDRAGNVWYFGEDTGELDANGNVVSTGPGWRAGVDGAPASLFMTAAPAVGQSFSNDYTKNDFAILGVSQAVTVPYGAFNDVVVSKESSPLEPDVEVHKYYARGVGLVRDLAVTGPAEELVLVNVEHS